MQITDILVPERVCFGAEASSKKRVMEIASRLLLEGTPYTISPHVVFDGLNARERLGSTGLGFGVALPHGRLGGLDSAVGAFVHTAAGVDFDSPDREPVDLVFALLVPEHSTDEHLQILSTLAEMFSDDNFRQKLRVAGSTDVVFGLLTG